MNIFSFHFDFLIDQSQASARELKHEIHFLKDYIHRLNAAASEYQTLHPPDSLKKDINVCLVRSKKVSSKFGVYEFLVFQQIAACNSMFFFLSIIDRLSLVKSIYLSNQKQVFEILS